ncbi:MAG: MerR family transcriptional regulator [Bacillota bacterium]|nr:MerR family transcriptional regulator [Bacillota bacterium]
MKIGTFARKFGLNVSTVRFYVNNGLLVPDKGGGQYEFGSQCVEDMKNILKYKQYRFSIEEIQLLFFMEKASRFQDEIVLEVCADILQQKRSALLQERDQLDRCIEELEAEIENLPAPAVREPSEGGVPFSYIPYLYCPHCQVPLQLDSASLANSRLKKGRLWCECGYAAEIEDGVVLTRGHTVETPFRAFDNVGSVSAVLDQYSRHYRMLMEKTYVWLYSQMTKLLEEPCHILAGPFTLNFLLEYITKLGTEHTYIIFDPSLKRINKLRQYLSACDHNNIIYVAGTGAELPVKKGSVDLYIDDYSTTNSLFTYNSFGTENTGPLLKRNGAAMGIFSSYKHAPRSIRNFRIKHPDFAPEKMDMGRLKHCWQEQGLEWIAEKHIGDTTPGESHYEEDADGEWVKVYGYLARKTPRRR